MVTALFARNRPRVALAAALVLLGHASLTQAPAAQAGEGRSPAHLLTLRGAELPATPAAPALPQAPEALTANPFGFTNATPAAECGGTCHREIFQSWSTGAGSDLPAIPIWDAADEAAFAAGDLAALDPYDTTARGNLHSLAWKDYEFQLIYHEQPSQLQPMCRRCHMPTAATEAKRDLLVFAPAANSPGAANATEGVTCVSCHLDSAGNILGPSSEGGRVAALAADDHPVVGSRAFADGVTLCAACHNDSVFGAFTKTVDENQSQGGDACVDCHMDDDFGEEGHSWPGGQSPTFRREALALSIPTSLSAGQALSIRVTNVGADHNVPTGDKFRAFAVKVEARGASGALALSDEAFITPLLKSPLFWEAETYTRVEPIPREGRRDLSFGALPAGTYTLTVTLTYYQIKPTSLVYRNGDVEEIAPYGARQVRQDVKTLVVSN